MGGACFGIFKRVRRVNDTPLTTEYGSVGKEKMQKEGKMKNKLLNIYCAKMTQDEEKVLITLVEGEDDERTFYNAVVSLDDNKRIYAEIEDGYAMVYIPLSNYKKKDDNLPF